MVSTISQVVVALTLTAPPSLDGHFMVITNVPGFQSLYKVGINGEATRIGAVGSMSPTPTSLTWEPKTQRLIASRFDEDGFVQWVEIDRKTGESWPLSFSRFPTTECGGAFEFGHVRECAADPNTGKLYCLTNCAGIVRVDVDTGAHSLVRQTTDVTRLTWVDGFLGDIKGMIAVGNQGENNGRLVKINLSTWQMTPIGGYPQAGCQSSFWHQNTLFCLGSSTSPCAFNWPTAVSYFDEVLGREKEFQCAYMNQYAGYFLFAFIPELVQHPFCNTMIDSDYDEDIDLQDFSRFQNCMSDPRPARDDGE